VGILTHATQRAGFPSQRDVHRTAKAPELLPDARVPAACPAPPGCARGAPAMLRAYLRRSPSVSGGGFEVARALEGVRPGLLGHAVAFLLSLLHFPWPAAAVAHIFAFGVVGDILHRRRRPPGPCCLLPSPHIGRWRWPWVDPSLSLA